MSNPRFSSNEKDKGKNVDSMRQKSMGDGDSFGGAGNIGKKRAVSLGFKMGRKSTVSGSGLLKPEVDTRWAIDPYPTTVVSIFEDLRKTVGVGAVPLHGEEDWVGNFMQQLHRQLSKNLVKSPLIAKSNLKMMGKVIQGCQDLVKQQDTLYSIVKLQSLVRGRQTRNRLKIWLNQDTVTLRTAVSTQSKLCQSQQAWSGLLHEEENYTNALETIVNSYLLPLRRTHESKRKSMLPNFLQQVSLKQSDLESIFANVEALLKVHQKNRVRFDSIIRKWPFSNVGEIFLQMAPELIVYSDYVANATNSLNTLSRCEQENPEFAQFIQQATKEGSDPLMGLLVRPLNHISQYMMFLKTMIKNSPSNSRDLSNLHSAYLAIKKAFKFIQESSGRSSNRAKMVDVQRRLNIPTNLNFELTDPKRQWISEGPIQSTEKVLAFTSDKQRFYFLFSDVFLLAEDSGKDKYKLSNIFMLKEAVLEETTKQKAFTLTAGQTKGIFAITDGTTELIPKLKELIDLANTTGKVFGVPLTRLLENEKSSDGIPNVVKTTTAFLKLRKQTEGLFRISGGSTEVASLKESLNKINEKPPNLNNTNPHAVAAVLKIFFRELPEPLLTFEAYGPLISSPQDVQTLKKFADGLPQANRVLMKYLASFLHGIAQYESQNKMGVNNLATVFGPNLLYPRVETLENILAIPKLNSVVAFLIQHHQEIFP
eukprot:TRINITY_DN3009_c0_g1_i1.p1 TRINITY_DN3009_c0_g1~~TRINITY_DN3009_c0_g1_i1.p1  ORF type:complete len:707 (-),score=234.45 TRINITY_DN3009_c0_g1_i1:74-2194(-)